MAQPQYEPGLLSLHLTCNNCGEPMLARYGQRWCCVECRLAGNAAEARAQRRLWRAAGRPRETELEQSS